MDATPWVLSASTVQCVTETSLHHATSLDRPIVQVAIRRESAIEQTTIVGSMARFSSRQCLPSDLFIDLEQGTLTRLPQQRWELQASSTDNSPSAIPDRRW